MINDQAIQEIKGHLEDYLKELGLSTSKLFTCVNPQHEDKHPSMSFNSKNNTIKCFSCDMSYDIISLYALKNNLDNTKDFKKIVEDLALKYNVKIDKKASKQYITEKKQDFTKYYIKCNKEIGKTDYLEKRGISKRIIDKYNIGYDENLTMKTEEGKTFTNKMVILPISKTCYIARNTDNTSTLKHYKPKGLTNEIFNSNYLKNSDFKTIIWVTESIIDSLSLEEAKEDIKTISLNSISNTQQLINEAQDNNYKGVFIIAFDTDTSGINASRELKEDLDTIGIKSFIFNSSTDKYNTTVEGKEINNKDINEWLLSDKERLINNVNGFNDMLLNSLESQAKKLYEKENVLNFLDTFSENIKDKERNKPLSTGIKQLDDALEGGFYRKNLVILGAISSLGKTTLALQIGDNIARSGNDVLIFSLEMSKEELIAKSLSRNTYLKAYDKHYTALALTTREILKGVVIDESDEYYNEKRGNLYKEAYEDYKENIANNVYITECNDSIEININTINEKIKNHIAITNTKPFVIIDYLQIIQHQERGLTDKQVIDKIVTSLKRIARDNDITILLISAFNRASYNKESGLDSFRDSSTIEYTSDVLISLQHEKLDGVLEDKKKVNTNQEQQRDERDLTLKVLKNRNGRITDVKDIVFYAKYNYMKFND